MPDNFIISPDGGIIPTGWVKPDDRTNDQNLVDAAIKAMMPKFRLAGKSAEPKDGKSLLWEGVRPLNGGADLLCFYQLEGSCVGEGMTKAVWYVEFMEVLRGEPEKPILPYMPFIYGQSRVCAGIRSRSHGSTGTGAADAVKKYGVLRSDYQGLKGWKVEDQTLTWGSELENMWMNGAPSEVQPEASKHLIKTTAQVRTTDELRDGLINKYPATCASDFGGAMQPPVREGVLLNSHQDTWNHQMMVCGWWDHPVLGEIYYIQNSWNQRAHGKCPSGAPLGGFWILKKDMQYIIDQGETFLISQFDGFPADMIPWIF